VPLVRRLGHAHVDVSSGGLVCWVKAHSNSPLVVHIDVGGTRIAKTKVLQEHAEIESFPGSLRSRDVLDRSFASFYGVGGETQVEVGEQKEK